MINIRLKICCSNCQGAIFNPQTSKKRALNRQLLGGKPFEIIHPDVFNLRRRNTGTSLLSGPHRLRLDVKDALTGPFLNEPLSGVSGPQQQQQQQRKTAETNNNCTVFGRGERSQPLLSLSTSAVLRKRGEEKQRTMSWHSFGVELKPQSLILKRAGRLCDVVCACVCSWVERGCVITLLYDCILHINLIQAITKNSN